MALTKENSMKINIQYKKIPINRTSTEPSKYLCTVSASGEECLVAAFYAYVCNYAKDKRTEVKYYGEGK